MNKKVIVTICREYCSGGVDIGKKLAEKLNFDFYDNELITLVAKESGLTEDFLKKSDEKPTNSLLYSIAMGTNYLNGMFFQSNEFFSNDKLFAIQCEVIRKIGKKGSCIIVGRCSDYILKEEENLVRVYLRADIDFRVKRLLKEKVHINKKDAKNIIYKTDKKRAHYYSYYTGNEWQKLNNYDIVLNTSKIGIDGAVEQILNYIKNLKDN